MINIYEMELHQELAFPASFIKVLRVPGGWIYEHKIPSPQSGNRISTVFVPYNEEFKPKPKGSYVVS